MEQEANAITTRYSHGTMNEQDLTYPETGKTSTVSESAGTGYSGDG